MKASLRCTPVDLRYGSALYRIMCFSCTAIAPNNCSSTPGLLPHGGGVVVGGEISAGLGRAGGTVQGQAGYGAFYGQSGSVNTGGFAEGVAAGAFGPYQAGAPNQGSAANGDVNPIVGGAYAGVGAGGVITNATNVKQLSGPFQTFTVSTPVFSLGFSYGGWIWSLSGTIGGKGG
jgi:hypothetical protein